MVQNVTEAQMGGTAQTDEAYQTDEDCHFFPHQGLITPERRNFCSHCLCADR